MKISIYDLQGQKVETYSVLPYFLSHVSCSCAKPADKEVGVCKVTPEGQKFTLIQKHSVLHSFFNSLSV